MASSVDLRAVIRCPIRTSLPCWVSLSGSCHAASNGERSGGARLMCRTAGRQVKVDSKVAGL